MGLSSHSVEKFGAPFLMVDELVFVIPAGGMVDITHHHFKFLFILSGDIQHEIKGIDGRGCLREGDVLVTPPVKFHRYINPDSRHEARIHTVRLFLDPTVIKPRKSAKLIKPETSFEDFIYHYFSSPVHFPGGIDTNMRMVLAALRRESESRGPGYRHRVRSLCADLVVFTARHLSFKERESSHKHAGQVVAVAMEFIQKHFTNPDLKLGAIAWHAGKGDEYLTRCFKRETGRSVFEYVRELRINHAKTLLLDSSLSFGLIAERCGFHSLAYFSRTFKQIAGLAPSAYRRNLDLQLKASPIATRPFITR